MEANEYKQRLGERAMDLIAYGMGLDKYKSSKKEACCPFHKEKTPSFKWDSKRLQWKCFGCGQTMDIYRYYTEFMDMSFIEAVKETANLTGGEVKLSVQIPVIEYKKPNIKTASLSKNAIDYMALRKISLKTLQDWKVVEKEHNGRLHFVFQYFDENNELQFVSYREIGKSGVKGGCEKDTKPILWGMWLIDKTKPVVITEGQPDAMAIWEAGYKNVVSVPSGSNSFTWVDTCWEWLQDIGEIILFGDNDEPGLKMINELIVRLGKYRTKVIQHKYKDANEVLYYQGKDEILKLINDAIKQTPAGIINMSQAVHIGIKEKLDEGIPTGFYGIDSTIDDLQPEQISILVGRNGEGKSTVTSQIIANCINTKIPVFLYSGEMSTQRVLNWLFKQVIGDERKYFDFIQTKYKIKSDIKLEALQALKKWSADLFFTFDKTKENVRKNTNELFEVMSVAVKRYGCKLIIIDNLMSAMEDNADSINTDQSNFVQQCKDFAENYRVHIMLVVHPNKLKKAGEKIEKEDISGSNNIPNKADVVLAIEKQIKEDRDCDSKLRLLKDREEGRYKEVKLMFQDSTKRLLEIDSGVVKPIQYGWKKYIQENPEPQWWDQPVDNSLPF
jgi:DNA primase (bacterial type)